MTLPAMAFWGRPWGGQGLQLFSHDFSYGPMSLHDVALGIISKAFDVSFHDLDCNIFLFLFNSSRLMNDHII